MQSQLLRIVCILMYILSFPAMSISVMAYSDYGPHPDPVINKASENALISITCPPSITYGCMDNDTLETFQEFLDAGGSINIPSECSVITFTHQTDVFLGGDDCTTTYSRGYMITTDCGSTFECGQLVMLTDQDPPMITCPSNVVLSVSTGCDTMYVPSLATATDDCGIPTITNDAPSVFPFGETTITYTAIDVCGNTAICTSTVTVDYNGELIVNCPDMLTEECLASNAAPYTTAAEFLAAGGTVMNGCSTINDFTITTQNDSSDGGSCPETVTRTYMITDVNNNSAICTQTIVVDDIAPPTFTLPANIAGISCLDLDDLTMTGNVTNLMDNCGGIPTSTYTDTSVDNGGGSLTITRTFTVTDGCDNSSMGTQTIEVMDNERPTAVCRDVTFYLDTDGTSIVIADSLNGGSFDDCTPFDELTFELGRQMVFCNDATLNQQIELIVIDAAGLRDTCESTVVVLDTIPPVLTGPVNDTVTCIADIPPAFSTTLEFLNAGGTLIDNCPGPNVTLSSESAVTGVCPKMLTRIYEFTDVNGMQSDTAQHTIIVLDEEAPIISCPSDIVISETDICDTLLMFGVTLTDGCGDAVITNSLTGTGGTISERFSGGVTTIEFIATDPCGNADTCSMTVTILAPTKITFPPFTFTCSTELPSYTNYQMFEDAGGSINGNCGIDVNTFTYDASFSIDPNDNCQGEVKEVVSFGTGTDICRDSMITTLVDTLPPEVDCSGSSMIFAMQNPDTCLPNITSTPPSAKDNFGVVDFELTPLPTSVGPSTAYWVATDACGNADSCEVTINVVDGTSPLFRIDTLTALCPDDVPEFSTLQEFLDFSSSAIAYDCNLDESSFMFVRDTILNGMTGKVYIISDTEGNTSTEVHFFDLQDSEAPTFTPSTMSNQFGSADATTCVSALSFDFPTPSDDHGIDSLYTLVDGMLQTTTDIVNYNFEVGTTTVTYVALDSCGRDATITFDVTILDVTSPIFTIPSASYFCASMFPTFSTLAEFLAYSPDAEASDCNLDESSFTFVTDTIVSGMFGKKYFISDIYDNTSTVVHFLSATDMDGPLIEKPDAIMPISCGDPLPAQQVLTATDVSGVASIVFDTVPFALELCQDKDITYVWVATDSCGNINRDSLTFTMLGDNDPPSALAYPDTVDMSMTPGNCTGLISSLTPPMFEDDCSGVDTVYSTFLSPTMQAGFTTIEWVGVDVCNNRDTVEQVIEVLDTEQPQLTCDSLVSVNLTDEASNLVPYVSFVEDADDNCVISKIEVRRLTEVCDDPLSDEFGEVVRFCCEEVGDTVSVEVRVTDVAGLTTTCLTTAVVSDKLAPSISRSLPDITVSCGYDIDTTDLTEFGIYVFDEDDRDSIILQDQFYDATDGYAGRDGLVNENCTATQSDSIIVDIDRCNMGTLTRITTITDASGNKVSSEQTITIIDFDPFYIDRHDDNNPNDDIIWPATFEWDQCLSPAPDTMTAGSPIFLNEDECSQVSATYSDLAFEIGNGGCAYIRRRWKVIDWCQYDDSQSPNPGEWKYNQDIYVKNKTAPTFAISSPVDSTVCALGSSCVAPLILSVSATDDCTVESNLIYSYEIDINNNGSIDLSGNSKSINTASLEAGTHRVIWSVTDRCNNTAERVDLYTVRDCKLPTAVCLDGLSISLGDDGTVATWASDISNKSSDNCTAEPDLKLSFSADPDDFGKTFTCDDLGDNEVELWVTDEAGNQSFCTATINIQDNLNVCDNSNRSTTIMGQILTPQGSPMVDSKVSIVGAELADYEMSDEYGGYAFMDITAETDVEVTVDREDDDYIMGVNTLDIVKIQRHLLGLETFDSPYKLIAADATNDEQISPADLLTIRKLILGLIDELPNNKVWRFVQGDQMSPDAEDPWPFVEEAYVGYGDYVTEGDFVGVKVGDVDDSVEGLLEDNNIETRSTKYLGVVSREKHFTPGEFVSVPLDVSRDFTLHGLQFTIEYDARVLRYIDTKARYLNINDQHIGEPKNGVVTLSFDSKNPVEIDKLSTLLSLNFEAISVGSLSASLDVTSGITKSAAYDDDGEEHEVNLDYLEVTSSTIALHQNRPNPFFDQTVVEFDIPEEMEIDITIFDASGKIHSKSTLIYPAGTNTIVIEEELRDEKGVFYLKMDAAEYSEVIKMIKLK